MASSLGRLPAGALSAPDSSAALSSQDGIEERPRQRKGFPEAKAERR